MSDPTHIEVIKHGIERWNTWRESFPDIKPDLSNTSLRNINLYYGANLTNTDFSCTDLAESTLDGARLKSANLKAANLTDASLRKADLSHADLRKSNLTRVNFHRAYLFHTDLRDSNLEGASLDVSSCLNAQFHGAILKNNKYETNPFYFHVRTSMLDLLEAKGLDSLHPSSGPFLARFASDAFMYIHELKSPYTMEFKDPENSFLTTQYKKYYPEIPHDKNWVSFAVEKITALNRLYLRSTDDPQLVNAIRLLNSELIEFLKRHPIELKKLHWRTFEELIAELLKSFGWDVQLTKPSKDGGYDLFGIYRDISGIPHTWIIECKKWADGRRVGVDVARALYTVKSELNVSGALLATTSHFTKGVHDFKASRYDFELRDYEGILEWIRTYQHSGS